MTEAELCEAAGLVARFYSKKIAVSFDAKFAIQRRLLMLGVQLDAPLPTPDPRAPQGGSHAAMRAVV